MLGLTEMALKGSSANQTIHPSNFNLFASVGGSQEVQAMKGAAEPADRAREIDSVQQFAPIVVGESSDVREYRNKTKKGIAKAIFS
jgi:hypothetical protein